jgi:hypothetical protein
LNVDVNFLSGVARAGIDPGSYRKETAPTWQKRTGRNLEARLHAVLIMG